MEDMEDYFDFDKKKFREPTLPTFVAETADYPPHPPSLQNKKLKIKIDDPKNENRKANPSRRRLPIHDV